MKVYYTRCTPPKGLGHSSVHLHGAELQRQRDRNITEVFEPVHIYKILNFKNNKNITF